MTVFEAMILFGTLQCLYYGFMICFILTYVTTSVTCFVVHRHAFQYNQFFTSCEPYRISLPRNKILSATSFVKDISSSSSSSLLLVSITPSSPFSTQEEYNDFLPNPNIDWTAPGVVEACMETLVRDTTQGLEVCFAFSSDRCRAAIGGSLDRFNEYANNPIFKYLTSCDSYEIISIGPIIPGTQHRGELQTCLLSVSQYNDSDNNNNFDNEEDRNKNTQQGRKFLWTLQKERRPPNQGCWMIHEVLFVKNAFQQTL